MTWVALALSGVQALAAAAPGAPEAFLRRLYASYLAGDQTLEPTGKDAPRLFDARLLALIRRDTAKAKGEVGALDFDPICNCQDFVRLTRFSIEMKSVDRVTSPPSSVSSTIPRRSRSPTH